jgi:hypothetical protein
MGIFLIILFALLIPMALSKRSINCIVFRKTIQKSPVTLLQFLVEIGILPFSQKANTTTRNTPICFTLLFAVLTPL